MQPYTKIWSNAATRRMNTALDRHLGFGPHVSAAMELFDACGFSDDEFERRLAAEIADVASRMPELPSAKNVDWLEIARCWNL